MTTSIPGTRADAPLQRGQRHGVGSQRAADGNIKGSEQIHLGIGSRAVALVIARKSPEAGFFHPQQSPSVQGAAASATQIT